MVNYNIVNYNIVNMICSECKLNNSQSIQFLDFDQNQKKINICMPCLQKYNNYFLSRKLLINIKDLFEVLDENQIKKQGGQCHTNLCPKYPNCSNNGRLCVRCLDIYTLSLTEPPRPRCKICNEKRIILIGLFNNFPDTLYHICLFCLLTKKNYYKDSNKFIFIKDFYKLFASNFIKF